MIKWRSQISYVAKLFEQLIILYKIESRIYVEPEDDNKTYSRNIRNVWAQMHLSFVLFFFFFSPFYSTVIDSEIDSI